MSKQISAFKIKVNGKTLDYRLGRNLNLDEVKTFFGKKYEVKKIWVEGRHVLSVLEKGGKEFFLKLSTTEGISAVTKIEYDWNDEFNNQIRRSASNIWVPLNHDSGYYKDKLFYLITDKFTGEFLSKRPAKEPISNTFIKSLPEIIDFTEIIQELKIKKSDQGDRHQDWFVNKTKSWLESIPEDIHTNYTIEELFQMVKKDVSNLKAKPRHGDFTPWHLVKLNTGQLGLIDGEHAMNSSVELYDISYFIQRVFSVLQNPNLAEKILNILMDKKYNIEKLKVILAARAIGGFLDESLSSSPNYYHADKFKKWVITL